MNFDEKFVSVRTGVYDLAGKFFEKLATKKSKTDFKHKNAEENSHFSWDRETNDETRK